MEGWGEFIDQPRTTSNTSFQMCLLVVYMTLNLFTLLWLSTIAKRTKLNICLQTALQSQKNNTHDDIIISHSEGGLVEEGKVAPDMIAYQCTDTCICMRRACKIHKCQPCYPGICKTSHCNDGSSRRLAYRRISSALCLDLLAADRWRLHHDTTLGNSHS